ncbi:hypothetical protein GLOIN_2v1477262 [Rhizophagus irregularis DAOM 181602=DAOM 197198]|nr:hypothetical protein GLOIN_2v1477262 [Rhizophagus irregularis DAOM 181602=DAOM 197198]
MKNHSLWSCISELLISRRITYRFFSFTKDSIPTYSVWARNLFKTPDWPALLQPTPFMDDIFPSFLKTMGLFTGYDELLTRDPVDYWRSFTDICHFFSLIGLSRFSPLQSTFYVMDWSLSFEIFRQTLYPNNAVTKTSVFTQFRLKLWFDELPIMYKLSQRFPGLYADNSLCPICGTFMKTLEYLFICSPSYLDVEDDNPVLLNHKDVTTDLIERFLVKLATKVSSSPRCKQSYDELLMALHNLSTLGALFAALVLIINLYLLTPIISRIYLKLQREIYHGLWRSRCKIKVTKDTAKGILPSTLRSYKGPSVQPFRFSAPPIALSQADEPLSPLQASEWSSLGIKWLHSSLTQRLSWFHHLLGFLKSRTVLIWNNILAGCKIG